MNPRSPARLEKRVHLATHRRLGAEVSQMISDSAQPAANLHKRSRKHIACNLAQDRSLGELADSVAEASSAPATSRSSLWHGSPARVVRNVRGSPRDG
jgi:hypothetical protein